MFENLTDKLQRAFKSLRGQGTLTEENITDQFIQWLEYPKVRDCIRDETATPKDLRDRLRKLFGLEPEPSSYPPEDTEHETYSA